MNKSHPLHDLFENNKRWIESARRQDPDFFSNLAEQQNPRYLWIGCSDSRVPANTIVGLKPGEVFVHRNVANLVVHTDLNCLSVLQYAVDVLGVQHVLVCGHYGCGGIKASLTARDFGLVDNWLRHIQDIAHQNRTQLAAAKTEDERCDLLCELNVKQQVANVCHTTIVQDAWRRGQDLHVHGLIYNVKDGLLRDLGAAYNRVEQIPPVYRV